VDQERSSVACRARSLYDFFTPKSSSEPEIDGGFALAHWNGSRAVEEKIKGIVKVTIRCSPLDDSAKAPAAGVRFQWRTEPAPRPLGEGL